MLARFGLFVQENFLDSDFCERLVAEMLGARTRAATVGVLAEESGEEEIDEQYRRTRMADVSDATRSLIQDRLRATKPALEEHFSLTLGDVQKPQFLVYNEGDFFRPHSDNNADNTSEHVVSDPVARRRVSLVVFANGGTGAYAGGALTFYGLISQDARGEAVGIPITEAPGLLVAFRSETLHAVTPVTRGERCTIVSWGA